MKRYLFVSLLLLTCTGISAQQKSAAPGPTEILLGNVRAERIYDSFQIRYTIDLGSQVKDCEISLYFSLDGGGKYHLKPLTTGVTGDIGRIRKSGEKVIDCSFKMDDLRIMADKQIVFKVTVTDIKYKRFAESISVGAPVVLGCDKNELAVSLKIANMNASQVRWRGICYSDRSTLPSFENASVKRFTGNDNADVIKLDVIPGRTYYLRGIAVGKKEDEILYGETAIYTVSPNGDQ